MDLTEPEEIKKKCRNTQNYKRALEKALESPVTTRSNQSILKEIKPEYSLERPSEGLMLKLQYFGHLM